MEAINIPKDLYIHQSKLNHNDALLYSFFLTKAGMKFNHELSVQRNNAMWAFSSEGSFYKSIERLISLGLLARTGVNSYVVYNYKEGE
ncbi:hypothetical protein [Enterobacter hormaechei]|uniref:hypothetical protein n=1 Tax=Enterobacter hormaechei TaxID=158836 RepID=UPI0029D46A07|nr:hypothetical protein [Enterobacter hormaechei]MDX7122043.1 hypothetical protein [Enterobacter hormaechei]